MSHGKHNSRDEAALLAAILAAPDSDLPRLVYADWLDENDRPAGKRCVNGNRLTKDHLWDGLVCLACGLNRYAERAEFIRVQCELAREHPNCTEQGCNQVGRLRRREKDIIIENWRHWQPSFPPGFCCRNVWAADSSPDPQPWVEFCRGFVETVRAPLAALFGATCPRCSGEGCSPHAIAVNGPCDNREGAAAGLWASQPVTRVVLTDREPYWNGYGWSYFAAGRSWPSGAVPESAVLPDELIPGERFHAEPTPEAARRWLSDRACALGRARAGSATAPAAT